MHWVRNLGRIDKLPGDDSENSFLCSKKDSVELGDHVRQSDEYIKRIGR